MKQHPPPSAYPSKPLYFYVPPKKRKKRIHSLNSSPSTHNDIIKEYATLNTLYTFNMATFLMCKAGGFPHQWWCV